MAKIETDVQSMFVDKEKLAPLMREINRQAGISDDLPVTHAQLMEMMRADGIRPEDNGASRELLRMRYGDDYDPDNGPFLKENP